MLIYIAVSIYGPEVAQVSPVTPEARPGGNVLRRRRLLPVPVPARVTAAAAAAKTAAAAAATAAADDNDDEDDEPRPPFAYKPDSDALIKKIQTVAAFTVKNGQKFEDVGPAIHRLPRRRMSLTQD